MRPPVAQENETEVDQIGSASHTINLNTASQAEIELLPGIGPALAGRIIEYRQQHGPFRTLDDVDKVKGIGPKMLEKLRPCVDFGVPPVEPGSPNSGT